MPPRKKATAKPAAKLPLDGCLIALSGTFPNHSQSEVESNLITTLGATLSKTVTKTTTHLVTTDTDFNKGTGKVKQAQDNGIPIVKISWLEDCLVNSDRLDEKDHALDAAAAQSWGTVTANGGTTATNGKTKAKSTKRGAISDDEDDASPPPAKKAAAPNTNGKSKTAKAPKAAPKVSKDDVKKKIESKIKPEDAENNITTSKDLVVQVDEGCPLGNHRVYIDDEGLIYDASLNQTNAGHNNNKFYRIQVGRSPLLQ